MTPGSRIRWWQLINAGNGKSEMKTLVTVFTYLLAVSGYAANYVNRRELQRRRLWFAAIGIFLTTAVIWGGYIYEKTQSAAAAADSRSIQGKLDRIQDQNTLLITERDSLKEHMATMKADVGGIRDDNRKLSSLLEPFLQRARLNYPGFDDEAALQKFASYVARMQPKMIFLEDRSNRWTDHSTNLLHTVYFFRPQYSVGVWDVTIQLAFDKPFTSARADIGGAIVEDQGSRLTTAPDSAGVSYWVSYLREGNYVKIEIESQASTKIISMHLQL